MKGLSRTWLLLSAALLGLLGCAKATIENEPAAEQAPSVSTRWLRAEPVRDSNWLDAPGRVVTSPNDSALISTPLSARVVRVRVQLGQAVTGGQPLLDVMMPELIKAAGALRSAQLRLESWEERRAVVASLVDKQLAKAAELSEIRANIASVRGELESARAILRAAGESEVHVERLIRNGTVSLRAPFAGVVTSLSAKIGEMREPSAGPLLELVSDTPDSLIEARFLTSPPAGVAFEWVEPTRSVPLVLERLSPHADERDGSRAAWLRAAQGAPALLAGTLGRVRMIADDGWVVVPARALRERNGVWTVVVKEERATRALPVKLIQQSSSEALIEGLAAGALVAADASAVDEPRL